MALKLLGQSLITFAKLHSRDDNQILVVHSRWVYNVYGYGFEGIRCLPFFRFYAFFSKLASDFGDFETLCVVGNKTLRILHYMQNECTINALRAIIIAKSGSSFMGQASSIQSICTWNLECSALHSSRDAKSCIDHVSPIKEDPDLQWMALLIHSHSFAM